MIDERFVILGVFIFALGSIGYFKETIQGKVKPNKVTWFLWSLAPFIAFFARIKQGVGIQSLLTFIVAFIPLLIFLASFANKKSYWRIKRLDIVCGSLSLLGLILWQITKVGNIAILFSIFADFLAGVPTIIKSYKEPETENALLYFANAFAALITLLTIKIWTFEQFAFSVYIFLVTLLLALLIQFKLGKVISKQVR